MNEEIKEILDKLKYTADTSFFAVCGSQEELDKMPKSISKFLSVSNKDAKLLLNHITNLQQRCKYLERSNNRREDTILGLRQELDDVQQENERLKEDKKKAIELIRKAMLESDITGNGILNLNKLLNILQNGGDSNE